jgi:hypothetical protein
MTMWCLCSTQACRSVRVYCGKYIGLGHGRCVATCHLFALHLLSRYSRRPCKSLSSKAITSIQHPGHCQLHLHLPHLNSHSHFHSQISVLLQALGLVLRSNPGKWWPRLSPGTTTLLHPLYCRTSAPGCCTVGAAVAHPCIVHTVLCRPCLLGTLFSQC